MNHDMDVEYDPLAHPGHEFDDSNDSQHHNEQPADHQHGWLSPRKRRRSLQPDDFVSGPDGPLKRRKTAFNPSYLAFFNNHVFDVGFKAPYDLLPKLRGSQIGLSFWNPTEKEALFAAVNRLGRDDLPGIASAVQTKSVLEVRHYLMLLQETIMNRREAHAKRSATLSLAHHPAALEVDQELCNALEVAADDLALRQEIHEEGVEQNRWGNTPWLIDRAVARDFESRVRRHDPDIQAFGEFFVTKKWLHLSEHIFMNSVVEDCNWRSASTEPPAIRATAFDDFYSLAKSITRRLLATTLTIATSRTRRRRQGMAGKVKLQDVRAARLSLAMDNDGRKFWARAARRLRLNVHNDEGDDFVLHSQLTNNEDAEESNGDTEDGEKDGGDSDNSSSRDHGHDYEDRDHVDDHGTPEDLHVGSDSAEELTFLTYEEVEKILGFPSDLGPPKSPSVSSTSEDEESDLSDDDENNEEIEDIEEAEEPDQESILPEERDNNSDSSREYEEPTTRPRTRTRSRSRLFIGTAAATPSSPSVAVQEDPLIDPRAVEQDVHEAIYHSAIDYAGTTRAKDAIRAVIAAEHRHHAKAEELDMQASKAEEARLWAVLREEVAPQAPASASAAVESAGRLSSAAPTSGEDDNEYSSEDDDAEASRGGKKAGWAGEGMLSSMDASDWRARLDFVSEWESEHQGVRGGGQEAA